MKLKESDRPERKLTILQITHQVKAFHFLNANEIWSEIIQHNALVKQDTTVGTGLSDTNKTKGDDFHFTLVI